MKYIGMIMFAFLIVDAYINGKVWLSRIYIGRYQDAAEWKEKVKGVAKKWFFHTPVIKKTDQSRLILKDILRGNYKNGTIQSWQLGGLYLGLTEHFCKDEELKSYESRILDERGNWINPPKEVDAALLAFGILRRTRDSKKVRPAMDDMYQVILDRIDETDGCVCYRKIIPKVRFVDTIGFICPFLVCYGQKYDVPEAVQLAYLQIQAFVEKGMLKDSLMPVHAYHGKSGLPMGAYGWGRGVGWFLLGLLDTYLIMEDSNPEKAKLRRQLKESADYFADFQNENGGFSANLCIGDRQDSSITAIAAYFYRSCFQIFGEKSYQGASDRCIEALMKVTRRSGAIDFSQGDTKGMGTYAQTFDIMPFTQGMICRLN